jgi:predicted amidohydrolase YtcJ
MNSGADLLIVNGAIFAGEANPGLGSVAIRSGRIVEVGPDLRTWRGPKTEVVDAGGGLVTAGFIDAHVHPVTGGLKLLHCSLDTAASAEEALARVKSYANTHPATEWIWGGGWSLDWFPGGTPSAGALDQVTGSRPAFLYNRDGHGGWANSAALERAAITAATSDPADGRIERLADGSPQGTLHEGAMALVEAILPPVPAAEWERALAAGQRYLLSCGITGWQDAATEPEHEAAYLALVGRDELAASVVAALWWDRHRGLEQIGDLLGRRALQAPGYRPTSVKLMLDGIVENYTAALLEPYLDTAGAVTANSGIDFIDPAELREIVSRLDRLGFQCHFHAIGSRAVRNALDAVGAILPPRFAGSPPFGGRNLHHIAHLQIVDPRDVPKFARVGVAANLQALWACNEPQMTELTLPFLGPHSVENQYPFASLRAAGVPLAMGSDWPVSTANVFEQIEVAVTRRHPLHRERVPLQAQQALTLDQALTAFTAGSARVNRVEDQVGRIEAGMRADLAVADRNPFLEEPIGETRVTHTIKGGRPVYRQE